YPLSLHDALPISRPPADTPAEQQARFDRFRNDFNDNRPHEALGQMPPASRYRRSPRPYPAQIEDPWYDAEHAVRHVRSNGEIRWGGDLLFLGEALIGEPVGIAETEAGDWIVRFADVELGIIDRITNKFRRFMAGRPAIKRPQNKPRKLSGMYPVYSVRHVSGCTPAELRQRALRPSFYFRGREAIQRRAT